MLAFISKTELDFSGFSFHVGSGCKTTKVFDLALKDVKTAISIATSHGLKTNTINIGGGFPGEAGNRLFPSIANEIKNSITELGFDDIKFISEPGRFFVRAAFYLAINIHSMKKKHIKTDQVEEITYMYYVDEGTYGSFNKQNMAGIEPIPKILSTKARIDDTVLFQSSIWGPTCDSIDCLHQSMLPKLNIGDWLYYDNCGAYTIACATSFNGMDRPKVHYTFSD